MKRFRRVYTLLGIYLMLIMSMTSLTGCSYLSNLFGAWKSNIIGTSFKVMSYDVYGNNTMTITGDKISVTLFDKIKSFDGKPVQNQSKVLELTVDGKQVIHVGSTLVMAEKGLDVIEDFSIPKEITSDSGLMGITSTNRFLNYYKNKIGKSKIIVIRTQQGLPIGIYQGKRVNVEVDNELPTFTRIDVDGKSLYIYRADYTILDSSLIE